MFVPAPVIHGKESYHGQVLESVLLKETNDLLLLLHYGKSAVLVLLDVSSALKAVDHSILLNCLNLLYGICSSTLQSFSFYLQNSSTSVKVGNSFSTLKLSSVTCGVSPVVRLQFGVHFVCPIYWLVVF